MTTPSSPITTVQDKYNAVQTAHQTQEDNLRSFIQQAENRLRDLQNKIQDFGQKQQDFTTKLDQTLQTLEQEIGKSSGIIASLSPGNSLSKKELVTQKRVSLLQSLKQVEGYLGQLDQEVSNVLNEISQGLQQAQQDGDPVRISLQDLVTEIGNLNQELKKFETQAQAMADSSKQPAPPVLAQGTTGVSVSNVDMDILTKLGQAEVALIALKQALEKSRLMQQVIYNISELGYRHNLQ